MRIGQVKAEDGLGQRVVEANGSRRFGDPRDFRFCVLHGNHPLFVVTFLSREVAPLRREAVRGGVDVRRPNRFVRTIP